MVESPDSFQCIHLRILQSIRPCTVKRVWLQQTSYLDTAWHAHFKIEVLRLVSKYQNPLKSQVYLLYHHLTVH